MEYSYNNMTGILATTGPTLHTVEQLNYAMLLGVKDFRLALSSRDRDVCEYIRNIRKAEIAMGCKANILLDFPASRPRTEEMVPMVLEIEHTYIFCDAAEEEDDAIKINNFSYVINSIKINDRIFFRDGKIQLKVEFIDFETRKVYATCYLAAADLRTNCSCVFPDTDIVYEPIVDLDIKVLNKLSKEGLSPDWFGLSFASNKASIELMKNLAKEFWPTKQIRIMAKIETPKGIHNINEILQCADGIMVARGDLLLHIPPIKLPRTQEYLVNMAKENQKVSVIATEFLEIYATTGIINRAELSDIALGTQQSPTALMLSMESANSKYSKECIELMAKVIEDNYTKMSGEVTECIR